MYTMGGFKNIQLQTPRSWLWFSPLDRQEKLLISRRISSSKSVRINLYKLSNGCGSDTRRFIEDIVGRKRV